MFDDDQVAQIASIARAIELHGRIVDFPDADGRTTPQALGVRTSDAPDLLALVSLPRLAGAARAVLSDDVLHLDTRVSLKRPGTGAYRWHQEYRYWCGRGVPLSNIVSAMIYLEPASAQNGCLQLIPGSHAAGLMSHHREGGQHIVPDALVEELARRTPPTFAESAAGAVLFFGGNTLHASAANESMHSRLAVLITYNAKSNGAIGEGLLD